jgi:hypothetical protein
MVAVGVFVGAAAADKPAKNQMVKGTIKTIDVDKQVLVVNQKVKDEVVERQLDNLGTTEFVVTTDKDTVTKSGAEGLELLKGHEGASVKVKCDKDVNVLQVTVTISK